MRTSNPTLRLTSALILAMAVAACTPDADPAAKLSPTIAGDASSDPCAQSSEIQDPTGLLEVEALWPDTTSVTRGYRVVSYDRQACSELVSPDLLTLPPDCSKPFPWIAAADKTDELLGSSGVTFVYSAMVSGHRVIAEGEVAKPMEVREVVMVLRTGTTEHPLRKAAEVCADPLPGTSGYAAYRTTVRSAEFDSDITAVLAIADDKLIWLEFDPAYDPRGWEEHEYLEIANRAVAKANKLSG